MIDIARIRELLESVPCPPEDSLPEGCSDGEIDAFSGRTHVDVPDDLRVWLKTSNGPCVGPGGLFGIKPSRHFLDIESILDLYPSWREKKWIPIGGDGSGNYYVVPCLQEYGTGYPVVFVDTHETADDPCYVVASDVSHFLVFLLEKELGTTGWPFSEQFVVGQDPSLLDFHGIPLPWKAL